MRRARYAALSLLGVAVAVPFFVSPPPARGTVPPGELADPDSRFISFGGLRVHFKIGGHGRPAFLLLHGFGASLFSWRDVAAGLAARGTAVAFDRPGAGLTARPMPGQWRGRSPYSLEAAADLAVGLLDALALPHAVLVAHSAGARVALLVAARHPQRVQALVLANPAVYGGGPPPWLQRLLATPQGRFYGPLFVRCLFRHSDSAALRRAWHDPSRVTPEMLAGYRQAMQVRNWDRALWELTVAGQRLDPQLLPQVTQPALVIAGGEDRMVPRDGARLAADLPQAQLAILPGCGHLVQEECPQAFLDAVNAFLDGLEQT